MLQEGAAFWRRGGGGRGWGLIVSVFRVGGEEACAACVVLLLACFAVDVWPRPAVASLVYFARFLVCF